MSPTATNGGDPGSGATQNAPTVGEVTLISPEEWVTFLVEGAAALRGRIHNAFASANAEAADRFPDRKALAAALDKAKIVDADGNAIDLDDIVPESERAVTDVEDLDADDEGTEAVEAETADEQA